VARFDTRPFQTRVAGIVEDLDPVRPDSLAMQMVGPLLRRAAGAVPPDALLLVATTVGEVDLLERCVLTGRGDVADSRLDRFAEKVRVASGIVETPVVVSAACASSTAALAYAAALVRDGEREAAVVIAADSVTEFIFSGFSSLLALDPDGARPFDRDRKGLTLGEAATYLVVMSESRAQREHRPVLGEIAGWGLTNDANHMTGPSRDGGGLAAAITKALATAGEDADSIASVSAHGTGTLYNDSMELKAFRRVFPDRTVPAYSIKGGTGHTMGATGLVEALLALHSLREQVVPPTVGLKHVDDEAAGWVSSAAVPTAGATTALSTNAGFGGVNAALVLRRGEGAGA
jgi:3-oxoacyl-[acyl-carrier-protein] synthase II